MCTYRSAFARSAATLLLAAYVIQPSEAADKVTLKAGETFGRGLPGPSTITGRDGDDWLYGDPATSDGAPVKVERLSRSAEGKQIPGDVFVSGPQAFSADGRKLLMVSAATSIAGAAAGAGHRQVWIRDLADRSWILLSATRAGQAGNGDSGVDSLPGEPLAAFAPNGGMAVFTSRAPNLTGVAGDAVQILAADRFGEQVVVSAHRVSDVPGNGSSSGPVFARSGDQFAYKSMADLGYSVSSAAPVVVTAPIVNGEIRRDKARMASGDAKGAFADGEVSGPQLSPNGRLIAFATEAPLVTPKIAASDVVVRRVDRSDLETGALLGPLVRANARATDAPKEAELYISASPTFSPDGREVAFHSRAALVGGDGNGKFDVFIKTLVDTPVRKAGSIRRVSTANKGGTIVSANGDSQYAVYSPDGARIAFLSKATNLAAGVKAGSGQLLSRDLDDGSIDVITRATGGGAPADDAPSYNGADFAFSPDGRQIAYTTKAATIQPGDGNGAFDVYLVTLPVGPSGDDVLMGFDGRDHLFGGAGNDRIDGGAGADFLFGGTGDDVFEVDSGADVIVEHAGEGRDTIRSTVTLALPDNLEALELTGPAWTAGTGNARANRITGNSGSNLLEGEGGDDWLFGRGGQDTLDGGEGDDRVQGGRGRDVLTGGPGRDRFVYRRVSDSPAGKADCDTITDFVGKRGDRIDLSAIDANRGKPGNQRFRWIGNARFSGRAGELRFSRRILQGDVTGDRKADIEIDVGGAVMRARYVVR